jgi:hypothetical protein
LSAPDKKPACMDMSGREEDRYNAKDNHRHQGQDDEHVPPSGGRWIVNLSKGVRDNVSVNLSESKIGIPNAAARRCFGLVYRWLRLSIREGAIAASNVPRKFLAAIRER